MKDYLAEFEVNPFDLYTLKDLLGYIATNTSEKTPEYGIETWKRAERVSQEPPRGSREYLVS